MTKPTLTYYAARGRAELVRVILAEAGVDYAERLVGKEVPFDDLKKSGTLPFDAIPVWDEPDAFRLAQSNAIAVYIAAQHGLRGKDVREAARCDQMLGAYDDLRGEMRKLVMVEGDKRTALRAELDTRFVPRWLGYLDRLLASNHDGTGFLVGDGMTMADCALWYILEIARDNGFAGLDGFPRLGAYAARIGARPRIAGWVASPRRHPLQLFPR